MRLAIIISLLFVGASTAQACSINGTIRIGADNPLPAGSVVHCEHSVKIPVHECDYCIKNVYRYEDLPDKTCTIYRYNEENQHQNADGTYSYDSDTYYYSDRGCYDEIDISNRYTQCRMMIYAYFLEYNGHQYTEEDREIARAEAEALRSLVGRTNEIGNDTACITGGNSMRVGFGSVSCDTIDGDSMYDPISTNRVDCLPPNENGTCEGVGRTAFDTKNNCYEYYNKSGIKGCRPTNKGQCSHMYGKFNHGIGYGRPRDLQKLGLPR